MKILKKLVTSLFALLIITNNVALAIDASGEGFPDVNEKVAYHEAINWMAENGVINGHKDGYFRPDNCVNRVELLKMIFETLEVNETGATAELFPDTFSDQWYAPYVRTARERGSINGYPDGTFKPENCVNRVEAIKVAEIEFGISKEYPDHGYNAADIDRNAWYFDYLISAMYKNLVGTEHTVTNVNEVGFPEQQFFPGESMSRKEVAEMLYRMKAFKDHGLEQYTSDIEPLYIGFTYPHVLRHLESSELEALTTEFNETSSLAECELFIINEYGLLEYDRSAFGNRLMADADDPCIRSTESEEQTVKTMVESELVELEKFTKISGAKSMDIEITKKSDYDKKYYLNVPYQKVMGLKVFGTSMQINADNDSIFEIRGHVGIRATFGPSNTTNYSLLSSWLPEVIVPLKPEIDLQIIKKDIPLWEWEENSENGIWPEDEVYERELIIFPLETEEGIEFRLAFEEEYACDMKYIDAITGMPLYEYTECADTE